MKKIWEAPRTVVQGFEPNEYVAACVTGTIQCAIPGRSEYICDGSSPIRNFNYDMPWGGKIVHGEGLDHGICGDAAPITFNGSTGSGYEVNHGVVDRNRPIYNIEGYQLQEGTYDVIWNSNSGGPEYTHYGKLTITNIDNDRPNHP